MAKAEKIMQMGGDPPEESIPFLVKTQLSVEKLRVALQVRNTHLHKQGRSDLTTEALEEKVRLIEEFVDDKVADMIVTHPAYYWFSQVKGVGRENIGKVVGLIRVAPSKKPDKKNPGKFIERGYAKSISGLWKFAGFSVENGKAPKAKKGEKLPYNKELRAMCWRLGEAIIRAQSGPTDKAPNRKKGKYYEYFIKQKNRYTEKALNDGYKIVPAAKLPTKNGKKYEPEGVISLGHIKNRAERKMIKLLLGHLWIVWREALNLPASKPYVVEKLGHNHYIDPYEFTG